MGGIKLGGWGGEREREGVLRERGGWDKAERERVAGASGGGGGGESEGGRSQEDLFSFSLGQFGSPYPGQAQQPQEQRYPFLPVCSIFMSLNNGIAASVSVFNVLRDADTRDCTQGAVGAP